MENAGGSYTGIPHLERFGGSLLRKGDGRREVCNAVSINDFVVYSHTLKCTYPLELRTTPDLGRRELLAENHDLHTGYPKTNSLTTSITARIVTISLNKRNNSSSGGGGD